MQIFGSSISGNCLKIKYVCDYLDLAYEWVELDLSKKESWTAEFLAMNPTGEVPTLRLDDGRCIGQSNAIMFYLAENTRLIPSDKYHRAKMNEWLYWEQYSHEPYIAVCRTQVLNLKGDGTGEREQWRADKGDLALDRMDKHLQKEEWLVGDHLTLADIALVAYTRVAHEGGFDVQKRAALSTWINRVEVELGIE